MKLHYYESILNFYCDSLTEEELLEKIREWTLRYLWYRKKREEEEGWKREYPCAITNTQKIMFDYT